MTQNNEQTINNKTNFIKHLDSLKQSYLQLLNLKFERYFCYQFTFEGDEYFGIKKQRLFFLTLYRYNRVAISKFGLGGKNYEKVVYLPWVTKYGVDANIKSAESTLSNINLKQPIEPEKNAKMTKKLTDKNAVFCELELSVNIGLYFQIQPMLQQIANDFASIALAQNFSLPKFIWKNYSVDRDQDFQDFEKSLYDFNQIFLTFKKENENSLLNANDPVFAKTTFTTPTEIAQKIDNIKNKLMLVFQLLGIKANINFKKERQITAEIETEEAEFVPNELQRKKVFEDFVKDYNEFYKTNIRLIDNYENKQNEQNNNDDQNNNKMEVNNNGIREQN